MTPLRVLIADDHPVVRLGLRAVLVGVPGLAVAGEAGDGQEAVRLAGTLRPDVVLMDLRMPRMDGVEATRLIRAADTARVLVLTTYDSDRDILRAVEAGAAGYLVKDAPLADLVAAIRATAAGRRVLSGGSVSRAVTRRRRRSAEELSVRELEVLELAADGSTNEAIARSLGIGTATVKTHLLHAFAKLGVDDRTAAVTAAMARGMLSPPERRPG